MNRILLREKSINEKKSFERMKIGVVPISQGAGATFVAASLAKLISERENIKVSFVEISKEKIPGNKLTFDSLGIDKRFAGRHFEDFFQMMKQGENTRGMTNIDDGVNWILHTPSDNSNKKHIKETKEIKESKESLDNLRIINNVPGDVIICDFQIHTEMMELLIDMEVIIVVIDPMPSLLIAGFDMLSRCKALEEKGMKVIWIVNKDNEGINKRELLKFLKLKELNYIPNINNEKLYSAEYSCILPISSRAVRFELIDPFNKIIKSIFG